MSNCGSRWTSSQAPKCWHGLGWNGQQKYCENPDVSSTCHSAADRANWLLDNHASNPAWAHITTYYAAQLSVMGEVAAGGLRPAPATPAPVLFQSQKMQILL